MNIDNPTFFNDHICLQQAQLYNLTTDADGQIHKQLPSFRTLIQVYCEDCDETLATLDELTDTTVDGDIVLTDANIEIINEHIREYHTTRQGDE